MTLANKITVLRILAIPTFVILLLDHHLGWARLIFSLSVASDALDGGLARLRGERTPLGAFLDPLADKLLLISTYVAFTKLGAVPVWVFITILSRDMVVVLGWAVVFILTGNSKIAPRPLGKVTTALQMAVGVAILFSVPASWYRPALYMMIAVTLISTFDYIWIGNKRLGELG